ncbi:MAG: accessory gene regulator B family protein [Lachnospiraceae bacterium]|nr:accessory gene regulator B family protein [Lachnospiraceae bacterium]
MFHNMVKKITDYMIEKNIIEEEMFDIYQYGFELMISSTITMLSIMIIACIMDSPLIGILYFFITVPLKVTAGGYHAPTYAKCFIISNLEYMALSLTAKALSAFFIPYYGWIILLMISTGYILLNCPVKNPNHPVSEDVLQKNQRLTYVLLGVDTIVITALYLLQQESYILNFSVLSIAAIAIFILPTKKRKEDNFHDCSIYSE